MNRSKLIFCTATQRVVTRSLRILKHDAQNCSYHFLFPRTTPQSSELQKEGYSVIYGEWQGLFAPEKASPALFDKLSQFHWNEIFILCSENRAENYSLLIDYAKSLKADKIGLVFPEITYHSIYPVLGLPPVTLEQHIGLSDKDILDCYDLNEFFYGPRAFPPHYTEDPDWEAFGGIFETTFICNFSCAHCPRKVAGLDGKKSIDPALFKHFIHDPHIRHITLLGLGETLLNPHFDKIAEALADRGICTTIVTNGANLTPERIASLASMNLTMVISMDAADEAAFSQLRQKRQFENIKNNIKRLGQEMPQVRCLFNMVVSDANYRNISSVVDLARELNIKQVTILNLLCLDNESDRHNPLLIPENERAAALEAATKRARDLRIPFVGKPLLPSCRPCVSPWNQMYVDMNGDVYPCCFVYRIPGDSFDEYFLGEKIPVPLKAYRLGNLKTDRIEEMWEGKIIRQIRRVLLESQRDEQLSLSDFLTLRRETDLSNPYNYCRICLYRWDCAC
jgi:MoaA/NifB/PqqE/SkfB family radical SAM enzyme